jgi:hypothetical protein
MAVDPTSRYADLAQIVVRAADGSTRVLGAPRVVPEPPMRGRYDVRPGDRLDLMAAAATGVTTRWWVLADANPWADARRVEQAGATIGLPRA